MLSFKIYVEVRTFIIVRWQQVNIFLFVQKTTYQYLKLKPHEGSKQNNKFVRYTVAYQ